MIKAEREHVPAAEGIATGNGDRVPLWHCRNPNTNLLSWLEFHAAEVRRALRESGAACLRGFAFLESTSLRAAAALLTGEVIAYRERTTPRRNVGSDHEHVYTSTEYPADQDMFLHNENAYAASWPAYIYFYCREPASSGGETSLADIVRVQESIDPAIRRGIATRGLLHRRTFFAGIGLPWQTVFGTPDRESLDRYCAREGYEVAERGGILTLEYRHDAQVMTPATREVRWFNHAAFFQRENLDMATRSAMGELAAIPALPNEILYGNGEPLERDVVAHLRDAYRAAERLHRWQRGDLLVLDNMRFAHGRRPFEGRRLIWTVMSGALRRRDLAL